MTMDKSCGILRTSVLSFFVVMAVYGAFQLATDFLGTLALLDKTYPRQVFMDTMLQIPGRNSDRQKLQGPSTEERGVSTWHMWDDEELFEQAMKVSDPGPDIGKSRKLAFMFLVRQDIPLAPFWERYFQGNEKYYSIYVHSSDQLFRLNRTRNIFWGRQVPSLPASRNGYNMVDAELRLLANALLDPLNQRFILLSESCIPVRPFMSLYTFLKHTPKSNVESFNVSGTSARTGGRWKEHLLPLVPREYFRKGSQWFEMHRQHAQLVVGDRRFWDPIKDKWTVSDEHYIPTIFSLFGIEHEITTQSLTHVNWTAVIHSHPHSYDPEDVQIWLFQKLRSSSDPIFFARKFGEDSLKPLLSIPRGALGF